MFGRRKKLQEHYDKGFVDGDNQGFYVGHKTGYAEGHKDGYSEGYREALLTRHESVIHIGPYGIFVCDSKEKGLCITCEGGLSHEKATSEETGETEAKNLSER